MFLNMIYILISLCFLLHFILSITLWYQFTGAWSKLNFSIALSLFIFRSSCHIGGCELTITAGRSSAFLLFSYSSSCVCPLRLFLLHPPSSPLRPIPLSACRSLEWLYTHWVISDDLLSPTQTYTAESTHCAHVSTYSCHIYTQKHVDL